MEMTDKRRCAFTLIEILVVIAIIAVLLGLAFPVFQGVLDRAKKVQAKNDVTQIVTAVNAFYTEYGRYPTNETTDDKATYGAGSSTSNILFRELRAKSTLINTRQIVFITPAEDSLLANPKGKIGSDDQFHDPWGTAYGITMDADYDSQVPNPYTPDSGAGPAEIRQGVIAWSLGKDTLPGKGRSFTGSDDILSWQ